jgi:hypothetical protein
VRAPSESDILVRVVQQLVNRLKRLGIEACSEDPRLQRLLNEVKAREAQGYAYEAADASFELLARGVLGGVPDFFDVESYQIEVERKIVAPGVTYSASQAVVPAEKGSRSLPGESPKPRFGNGGTDRAVLPETGLRPRLLYPRAIERPTRLSPSQPLGSALC